MRFLRGLDEILVGGAGEAAVEVGELGEWFRFLRGLDNFLGGGEAGDLGAGIDFTVLGRRMLDTGD